MTILEYGLVFILTILAGGWSIAAGVIFGLNPVGVYLAAVLASLAMTALILGPGARLFDSARDRYFPDAADKVAESKAGEIVERWGIPGLATVGGVVLGPTIIGTAVLVLGLDRRRFAFWYVLSILIGLAILTGFWVLVARHEHHVTDSHASNSRDPAFQAWMVSNVAVGAGWAAFVALLVPPYITQATGSASSAGVVMAMMSLAAVTGPVLGGIADRYKAHRQVLVGGLLAMTVALLAFGVASGDSDFQVIDALAMGLGVAGVSAVAPVFIVSAGLPEALQARRLTAFNVAFPAGQVAGGMLMAAAAQAEWTFSQRFYLGAAVLGILTAIVFFTSAAPTAALVLDADAAGDAEATTETRRVGLRGVLFSLFGLYLLILVLASVANNGVNNQIANILPNVYGISETTTSSLISLAGVLNILLFFAAGKTMTRYGPLTPFVAGTVMRFGGAACLGLLGWVTNAPVLLVAAAMQLLYQGSPFSRLPQNVLAVRYATIPSGQANGWVIAASALGSFAGSLLGGWLADEVGFNSISWMAAASAGLAVGLLILVIRPLDRQRFPESDEPADDGTEVARSDE